ICCFSPVVNWIPTTPTIMRIINKPVANENGSPKKTKSIIAIAAAPEPVKVAYTDPDGNTSQALIIKQKLNISTITVPVQVKKLSAYFNPSTQTTSIIAAQKTYIQPIFESSYLH